MNSQALSDSLDRLDAVAYEAAAITTDAISQSARSAAGVGRANYLVNAAYARLAEARAFLEMAAETKAPADERLARLDAVMRETVGVVGTAIERAGMSIQDGISVDDLDVFLARQEDAIEAMNQARVAGAAMVLHLDRALAFVPANAKPCSGC